MNDILNKYVSKLRSPKTLIIVGILGIALIFISSFPGKGETVEKPDTAGAVTAQEYREQLEKDIADMVTDITGSKRVSVIVTLENGVKYSYADTKEKTASDKTDNAVKSSDTELREGYVTVKTKDGGEQALLITEQMPEIRGVAVVCEGGDLEPINEKIKNTLTAALNITSKRVYICGRKQ